MGGKNHAPCGKYLTNSTRMSKYMSLAFAHLEMANVALEDLILAELAGKRGDIDPILDQLSKSKSALVLMDESTSDLRAQMDSESFVDLPSLKTTSLVTLGNHMFERGLHTSPDDWSSIAETMKSKGFYGVLKTIENHIGSLVSQTETLEQSIAATRNLANSGTLNESLEENKSGNFKVEFFTLYATWATFQQQFLASSVISTQLWYTFNQNGMLLEDMQIAAVA